MDERDFIVNADGDMVIRNGAVAVGQALTDDVALLLLTNRGELRLDPLAGCDLVRRLNGRATPVELERVVRVQVERDGKEWSRVKDGIKLRTNG